MAEIDTSWVTEGQVEEDIYEDERDFEGFEI